MWWTYLLGYLFSVFVGSFVMVRLVVNAMWKGLGWKGDLSEDTIRPYAWHPIAVGCLDSVLYTSAWLANKPEFIGVWLAIKVAGKWDRWTKDGDVNGKKIHGRTFFNIFLIGSGLTVLYSVIGAKIIGWLTSQMYSMAIIVPVILVMGTLILFIFAQYYSKK